MVKNRRVWWILGLAIVSVALCITALALHAQTPDAKLQAAVAKAFASYGFEKQPEPPSSSFTSGPIFSVTDTFRSQEFSFSELADIAKKIEGEIPDLTVYLDGTGSYVVLQTGSSFRVIQDVVFWTYDSEMYSSENDEESFTTIKISRPRDMTYAERVRSWFP